MIKIIEKIQSFILSTFYFIFPLFFLTYTSDPFGISKFYLLAFTGLLLLSLTTLSILITRKLSWSKSPFDTSILLFILTLLISLVFVSPNKISASLNINYGVISMFFLSIIFLYSSTLKSKKNIFTMLNLSAIIIATLSIVLLFQPFKNIGLPQQLTFLKSPYFTPIGARFDLILFSLFMSIYWGAKIFSKLKSGNIKVNKLWYPFVFFMVYLIAAGAAIFSIIKPLVPNLTFYLPSYKHSWFASVETLKSMLSALFGVGVDSFSNIFARIKDISFNQSGLWSSSINYSRSTILHIFTTTGLFGLLGFLSIVLSSLSGLNKLDKEKKDSILPIFVFILLAVSFVTPSLFLFFLFFITMAVINSEILKSEETKTSIDLKELIPLHFGIILVLVLFIGTSSYLLGRTYAASIYANNAIVNINKGNLSGSYKDQRSAINLNPYNESYRTFFSQTNLLYADAIIKNAKKDENNQTQLTENEKLQVSQAIQQSISEAKNSVALNSLSSKNWASLGEIYSNLINATQGSDAWAISSFQRAINLDPNNPTYRVRLGSIYYLLGKYPDSTALFRQAVTLKPDWANARFNLGWSLYQQKDYQSAATEMKTVLTLLDKDKNSQDYKIAKEAFDNFKKQVDLTQQEQQEASQGENLNLPQQSSPEISPKIDLPKTASPEAK